MKPDEAAKALGARGRVVILVDNTVEGDSRVQKTARSAAQAGWDVVLVGRSPDDQPQTAHLGPVEVRLVAVANRGSRRFASLRAWLREPQPRIVHQTRASQMAQASPGQADHAFLKGLSLRRRLLSVARRTRRAVRAPWDHAAILIWQTLMGDRSWRRLEPHLWQYELAYGNVIDELGPDLIHANDFRMLGVGARAVMRARTAGRTVKLLWDAHEFLPGIKPWVTDARWLPANCAHEREYAPYSDAVITVSADLAGLLQKQHRLAERPIVVLNAPAGDDGPNRDAPADGSLREQCGVGHDVPLLVYSGAAAPQRGLGIMIEALPQLMGAHVALVVPKPSARYVADLVYRATELGVDDRVHVLPYVPHEQVVSFLATADAGVIPIHHWINHEIALITKFFEYSHARLPIIVSDVRTMAVTVRSTGQGEVFRAQDVDDFIRAVQAVLADPQRYRAAYDRPGLLAGWTWEAQAEVLDSVYTRIVPSLPGQDVPRVVEPPAGVVA